MVEDVSTFKVGDKLIFLWKHPIYMYLGRQ